ncbi:MAG: hypothetical protein IIU03_10360 [Bacteroidales bacterium]|nr:hypothetical protein [Bacteroidales bacterium]MBR6277179.1 hypothetical protein [Bacteroidales bacterium]
MNKKNILNSLIILLLALITNSCGKKYAPVINEGRIVYSVDFPKEENSSSLVAIMPERVELSFKNDNTALSIRGFAGSFNISFITDNQNNKYYSLFRIMTDKYKYVTDSDGVSFGYDQIRDIEIEKLSDTMTICNYLCHKALAHCKTINRDLELWYTDDINIKKSNINNAFRDLDGVLLKFQVLLSGFFMELTAVEVVGEQVNSDLFVVPESYKDISKHDLDSMIRSFDSEPEGAAK